MRYLKVIWLHGLDDEPQFIYSEIGDDAYELRKVEIYKDRTFGLASVEFEFGGTVLAEIQIPGIEEIAGNAALLPKEIGKDEFEDVWFGCVNYLDKKH
ncbi:DUF6881 domain-containing protein [Chitinophaga rhizosphaerae]|uniref:DUF6881 domain-containing protein n=1 Tax=Chitinophaga rhizosphaerae TaxID=1864947 RepID=UPI000F813F49|nr:hypothetical protein [Chitinophaga rhizosphaerae]